MKKESWVVVANGTIARFFRIEKGKTLVEMEALVHPEGRLYEHDLSSDKAGNSSPTTSHIQHGMDPQTSLKKMEAMTFAKKICGRIDRNAVEGHIERLYLAATPTLLGLLRQNLNSKTASLIQSCVDKDITHLKVNEIRDHFPIGL